MKRMIALLLLLCMLTACAAPVPETEEPTAASQEIAVPEQKQPDSGMPSDLSSCYCHRQNNTFLSSLPPIEHPLPDDFCSNIRTGSGHISTPDPLPDWQADVPGHFYIPVQ